MEEPAKKINRIVSTAFRTLGLLSALLLAVVTLYLPAALATTPEVRGPWIWPTESPVAITTPFDPPPMPWNPGHRGVDLNVAIGDTIVSPASGTVLYVGTIVDRPVVSIMHAGGLRSTYEPVSALVTVGSTVKAGTPIGTVSEDGAGKHLGLHWGARFEKEDYIDPMRMLTGPSILKPWD